MRKPRSVYVNARQRLRNITCSGSPALHSGSRASASTSSSTDCATSSGHNRNLISVGFQTYGLRREDLSKAPRPALGRACPRTRRDRGRQTIQGRQRMMLPTAPRSCRRFAPCSGTTSRRVGSAPTASIARRERAPGESRFRVQQELHNEAHRAALRVRDRAGVVFHPEQRAREVR